MVSNNSKGVEKRESLCSAQRSRQGYHFFEKKITMPNKTFEYVVLKSLPKLLIRS